MEWLAVLISAILAALLKVYLSQKKEDKLNENIVTPRNDIIKKAQTANEIKARLVSDSAYAKRVREKYTRAED